MAGPQYQIVASDILFYHESDERAFMEWIDRMPFVRDCRGSGGDMFINFTRFPTDDDLWEIIGFSRRYGIDMTQLAKFETTENSAWMRDPNMVWRAEIFGNSRDANAA